MTKTVWLSLFAIMSAFSLLTIGKVISLQGGSMRTRASAQEPYRSTQNKNHYTERGAIFDRNDNILAMQIKRWNVGLRLIDTHKPQEVITQLSQTLSIPQARLTQQLQDPVKYVQIKRRISKAEHDVIKALQAEGKLKGVQLHPVSWREYPGKDSIAGAIGYYGSTQKGLDGIEYTYDAYLQPAQNAVGASVHLTIDSILQKSIEEIIKETQKEAQAAYIDTILMDATTGEILSYVSIPSFDNNQYYRYPQERLSNKIIQYNYEPGSVFKVFTVASFLDSGIISPTSTFNASVPFTSAKYGFTITDVWYPPGRITTSQIIKYSSNVGISHAMSRMDAQQFFEYLKRFGFGEKTGVPLPGEHSGILHSPERWSARSKHTIGFGQEIATTAMQMVRAATAITNGGVVLQPQLIKKIVSHEGTTLYSATPTSVRRAISERTATTILRMMKTSTEPGGTAHRMRIDGISISAKTGTAQVYDIQQKQYSEEAFIASALAIVPTEKPRIIIYAAIHKPTSGETYGGRTAAPMLRKMLSFILPYMGIAGQTVTFQHSATAPTTQRVKPMRIKSSTYQSYRGLSKRQIWTLFAQSSVKLRLKGSGHVVAQEPAAGSPIGTQPQLTLYFE